MKYKAEIFDVFQYLYEDTGFSDHQVHCVIGFENKVDSTVMKKAAELLVKAVPVLSRTYKACGGDSYWEDGSASTRQDLFTVTNNKNEFESFTSSKTNETSGPQIKFCLLQAQNDALSVVINHMVSDAAGLKQCMYLFSDIYSNLIKNPDYAPDYVIDGDRGFKNVVRGFSFIQKVKILLFGSKDNNQKSTLEFPLSKSADAAPFIASHQITPDVYRTIRSSCRLNGVTVNDVILTAYLRALSDKLNMKGKELAVPIMIDMRRYLKDKNFNALTNLSSTTIVKMRVAPDEAFGVTLRKLSSIMSAKKANHLGISTFIKLDAGFKVPIVNVYGILRKSLRNPKISMTNIGVLDSSKLCFENATVENAVMYASIKYRPYFQLSVTSFNDKMTIGAGLYGNAQDRICIEQFFDLMEKELGNACVI